MTVTKLHKIQGGQSRPHSRAVRYKCWAFHTERESLSARPSHAWSLNWRSVRWPLLPGTPLSSFHDLTLPFVTPRLDQEAWPLGGGRGLPNATPRALLLLTRSVSRVTSDGGSLLPKTPSSLALRQLSPSICTSSFSHRCLFLLFSSNVSDSPKSHPQPSLHPILRPPQGNLGISPVSTPPPISSWPPNLDLNCNLPHLISCANLAFPAAY